MDNLSSRLMALGLTQRQFARLTGQYFGTVNRWCQGTAQPPAMIETWLAMYAQLTPDQRIMLFSLRVRDQI